MGSQRTKEDDVMKISMSVFVANFPEQTSAKDLWNACKQYGHVVDAFIPNKRSKAGKRFGFVRFIKVFHVELLVGNLCTVWIGTHIIHANATRFHRPKGSINRRQSNLKGEIRDTSNGNIKDNGLRDNASSYAHVVKEFGVLENLKVALGNEGFTNIDLRYLGKTYWVRAIEISGWTPDLDNQNDEESDSEDEEFEGVCKENFDESDEEVQGENDVSRVSDTVVEEENPKSKDGVVSSDQTRTQSVFNIYSLLNKDKMKNNKEASTKESLEYPPGFTPREDDVGNDEMVKQRDNCGEFMDSDHYRESEGSRKGGSILIMMDELVKVGQTMGYNMEGCMKNIEEIIESQGVDDVFQ
ncbi:nucleotide-binding alpha-beta plait domain-containing protein [Tanacetum coccineum]